MNNILTVHQEFCQYQVVFKNNTPRTIIWFEQVIIFFVNYTGVTYLHELNQVMIENYFIKCKCERNWSPKTIRTRLNCLRLFFKWCVQREYLKVNPAEDIPNPKLDYKIPKHLTKKQATHILDWAKCYPYYYNYERARAVAIIAVFLFTGVRRQELLNLKLKDINLQSETLMVIAGKGRKDRLIPINFKLRKYLEEYLLTRPKINDKSVYFFVSINCIGKMNELVIKRLFQKIKEKSGVHFYAHLLRHTFAVLMLEGGCNLFSVSKMLGHSDIKTTTIYLSATVTHLQEQMRKHPLQ